MKSLKILSSLPSKVFRLSSVDRNKRYIKNMNDKKVPQAVVGVLVFKDGKILLGKRKRGDGKDEYAGPGGFLKFCETLEECAQLKVKEETNMKVKNVQIVALLN